MRERHKEWLEQWRTEFAWLPVQVSPTERAWLERYQVRVFVIKDERGWYIADIYRRRVGDDGPGHVQHIKRFNF